MLHGQVQEDLSDILIKVPAVSGALTYQELCVAAKNEERRQKYLSRRDQYRKDKNVMPSSGSGRLKSIRGRPQTDCKTVQPLMNLLAGNAVMYVTVLSTS